MAVQRGNVQCVQGAYGESAFEELDEIFYILQPNSFLTWIKIICLKKIWKTHLRA